MTLHKQENYPLRSSRGNQECRAYAVRTNRAGDILVVFNRVI